MIAYAGIDLHSTNSFVGIMDHRSKRLYGGKLPNDLNLILEALHPYKGDLEEIVVESTYNWYWLVDGLTEAGYPVSLANPSAMKQYEGMKYTVKREKGSSLLLTYLLDFIFQ